MGLMPKQVKAENIIFKSFGFTRIIGVMASLVVGLFLGKIVYAPIKWLFMLFCVLVFLVLSSKTKYNKTFFISLVEFLKFSASKKVFFGNASEEYVKSKEFYDEKNKQKQKR